MAVEEEIFIEYRIQEFPFLLKLRSGKQELQNKYEGINNYC